MNKRVLALAAATGASAIYGVNHTIEEYNKNRQSYYERLKHFDTFGRGWTRRVTETNETALQMV